MLRATKILMALCSPALVVGCRGEAEGQTVEPAVPFSAAEVAQILTLSPLPAPRPSHSNRFADSAAAAALGQRLFYDARLSKNGAIACATCHDPDKGFSDGRRLAVGLATGKRHTPSLWNVGQGRWFAWDGRVDSLWSQALGPLERADEMGSSRTALWQLVAGDEELRERYESVFGPLPTLSSTALPTHAKPGDAEWERIPADDRAHITKLFVRLGKALEAFERRLVSNDAPFDDFVRGLRTGDAKLLGRMSESAQRGLKTFLGAGQCILCHHGPNFSDGEFHNLGLPGSGGADADVGRYDGVDQLRASAFHGMGEHSDDRSEASNLRLTFVARQLSNLGEFKTPSLRHVAETAPYMHDGRFGTLDEVLGFYRNLEGKAEVGHREEALVPQPWSEQDVADLVAFLRSLTGKPLAPELRGPPAR